MALGVYFFRVLWYNKSITSFGGWFVVSQYFIWEGLVLKLFHLVLRKDGQNDWMRIDILDEDGKPLDEVEKLVACYELGKVTMGETKERDNRVLRLPAGKLHAGYFREHLAGLSHRRLYEIRMTNDMVPRLVFKSTLYDNDKIVLSFVPDRVEMVMVRDDRTDVIIRV